MRKRLRAAETELTDDDTEEAEDTDDIGEEEDVEDDEEVETEDEEEFMLDDDIGRPASAARY